jgi:hypothetical protein
MIRRCTYLFVVENMFQSNNSAPSTPFYLKLAQRSVGQGGQGGQPPHFLPNPLHRVALDRTNPTVPFPSRSEHSGICQRRAERCAGCPPPGPCGQGGPARSSAMAPRLHLPPFIPRLSSPLPIYSPAFISVPIYSPAFHLPHSFQLCSRQVPILSI